MSGQDGFVLRPNPMTVFSLVRPYLVTVLELVLGVGRLQRSSLNVRKLAYIHFARLAVIRRLPHFGQDAEQVPMPLLLFESNYDGTFDDYIDIFSERIPRKMQVFWGTSYGFPGVKPVSPFKEYIRANEFDVAHYYSAYPEGTTSTIEAALRLRPRQEAFYRRVRDDVPPDRFEQEFRAFLTDVQGDL